MIRLFALINLLITALFASAFQPGDAGVHRVHRSAAAQRLAVLRRTKITVALYSATDELSSFSEQSASEKLDASALLKYVTAIGVQMSLISAMLTCLDKLVATYNLKIPFVANFVLFYFLALKSRAFNPLANNRPQTATLESAGKDGMPKRNMPSWTPPGVVFPIVWLLIIGPIRAATSAMVYQTVGTYASLPILSLMLHFSIGDVWNTINNVERRYGVAVAGVLLVWLSKAHAAYQYSLVNCLAGKLLGATLIWLTIASALVTATWRLNPDPVTKKAEPLYPVTGKVATKFAWFKGTRKGK